MPLNLYKKIGETPLERLNRLRVESPEYATTELTYAGRLDPMAEGVLIVLAGEECKEKQKYLDLDKEYECEMLWGFETDTYDILGRVIKKATQECRPRECGDPEDKIKTLIENLKGKFKQTYPPYSSKPVNGKPLFVWAREGKIKELGELPSQEVEIYESEFLGNSEVEGSELLNTIITKIGLVKGDFRQAETIEGWKETLGALGTKSPKHHLVPRAPSKCLVTRFKIRCSSGTYIRSLVHSLGLLQSSGAVVLKLKRTKVGDFFY